jgi:hypothetical protein
MNFVGRRVLVVAVASIMSDVSGSWGRVDASSAVDWSATVDPSAGASASGACALVASAVSDAMGSACSV